MTVTVTVTPQAAATAAVAPADPATPASAAAQPLGVSTAPSAAGAAATHACRAAPGHPTAPPWCPRPPAPSRSSSRRRAWCWSRRRLPIFTALNITLPVPTGWTVVPDPNVPDAFSVIADRKGGDALYTPNAQVTVLQAGRGIRPEEAITHGFVDSQLLPAWQQTAGEMAEVGGFPASQISGTYRDTDLTLNTTRRHMIATAGSDRYLVSLSVTTAANQVVATAEATEAILARFKVAVPGSEPAASPEPLPHPWSTLPHRAGCCRTGRCTAVPRRLPQLRRLLRQP